MVAPFRPPVPALLLDEDRARQNIRAMAARARHAGVSLRPHFKTHQSAGVGEWFRAEGIDRCTVSSVRMARYFADTVWKDITIAFPFNRHEHAAIQALAREVDLGIILQSQDASRFIAAHIDAPLRLYIEIEAGDARSGISYQDTTAILDLARTLRDLPGPHQFAGVLYHAGYSYGSKGAAQILDVHSESLSRIAQVRKSLEDAGFTGLTYSGGDTPTCSTADSFPGLTEIRPGNFVFYDLMQLCIGSCSEEEIAMIAICPVVALAPERNEVIVYGGAVHLSKDSCVYGPEGRAFGAAVRLDGNSWSALDPQAYVHRMSQEHGVLRVPPSWFEWLREGDHVGIVPAHSCLTADLYGDYFVPGAGTIEKFHLVKG